MRRSVAEAAAELIASPRPALCLDTCVFLDVIRAVSRSQVDQLGALQILLQTLATTPGRLQLVVSSLVRLEWRQQVEEVRQEALKWIANTDGQISLIHKAWDRVGKPLPGAAPVYGGDDLVEELTQLARALLRSALVLKEDADCVTRTVKRVKSKRRPSHKRHVKDSIHWSTTWSCRAGSKPAAMLPSGCS